VPTDDAAAAAKLKAWESLGSHPFWDARDRMDSVWAFNHGFDAGYDAGSAATHTDRLIWAESLRAAEAAERSRIVAELSWIVEQGGEVETLLRQFIADMTV
jgi:hypothetical protein